MSSMDKIDPKKHHQLFIDRGAVDLEERISRKLHQPKKCGPLIAGGVESRNCPQWNSEKGLWEWWYSGRYATSEDGEHWENDIACSPADSLCHIVRDEADADPGRRYKALLGGGDKQPAVSPDGFSWTKIDTPPIPSSDESQFTYDPYTGQFLAMVKLGTEWGRSVWLSTSADFETFSEPKLIFHADEIDRENCRQRVRRVIDDPAFLTPAVVDEEDYIAEVYNMAVMPYQGLYVGFPVIFNPFGALPAPPTNFTRINQIELSVSRDLYNWERVGDREVFIGVEPYDGETYDTGQLLMAGQPVVRDDGEIWCYYNGLRWGSSLEDFRKFGKTKELHRLAVNPEHFVDSGALSLAKLRPDGFVSAEGDLCGVIVTKPFDLRGEDIYVNANANWGEIYVSILDGESRRVIPGFGVPGTEPPPVTGDDTRHKVSFLKEHDLVFEKPVRLKFFLHQASLYSFWIE